MRAYVMTSGAIFGLLVLIHLLRIVVEPSAFRDPFFLISTVIAASLCGWAVRVLRLQRQA